MIALLLIKISGGCDKRRHEIELDLLCPEEGIV